MLESAEVSLKRSLSLAQIVLEIEENRRFAARATETTRECDQMSSPRRQGRVQDSTLLDSDDSRYVHAIERVRGIQADIEDVKGLQRLFCTLTQHVKVLPCLRARFTSDVADCEEWWTTIRTSKRFQW
jgi:hypothetical protein